MKSAASKPKRITPAGLADCVVVKREEHTASLCREEGLRTMCADLREWVATLRTELAEARKDSERLKFLRELCGYSQDGSCAVVKIFEDDATREWFIKVDDKIRASGDSFIGVIDAARAKGVA